MLESCIMTETNWLGYTFHVRRAPRNNIMGLLWDGVKTNFFRYFFHRKTSCMRVWGWFKKEIYMNYFTWVGIMINLTWANTVIIRKWSILLLGHADQSLFKRHKSINLAKVWYISIKHYIYFAICIGLWGVKRRVLARPIKTFHFCNYIMSSWMAFHQCGLFCVSSNGSNCSSCNHTGSSSNVITSVASFMHLQTAWCCALVITLGATEWLVTSAQRAELLLGKFKALHRLMWRQM